MVDVFCIRQTLQAGGQWDGTVPGAGSSYDPNTGILTYTADSAGGKVDFDPTLFQGQHVVRRIIADTNGLAGGDNWELRLWNGSTERLLFIGSAGLYVFTGDQIYVDTAEELRFYNGAATSSALTLEVCAEPINAQVHALRQGNVQREFILATVPSGAPRNVAVGVVDREVETIKQEWQTDWSAPISTKTRYWWYQNVGDTNPIKIGPLT